MEGKKTVDIAENSATAYMLAMHTMLIPTREDLPEIQEILKFVFAAKTEKGGFHPYYDTITQGWLTGPNPHYKNAEILQNMAFTAFNMRLKDRILTEEEKTILDVAIENLQNFFEENQPIIQTDNGAWKLAYRDETLEVKLCENCEILTALLYVAAYEKEWGNLTESVKYAEYAQKTALWILNMQEVEPSHWGYGGFYQTKEDAVQLTYSNAVAIFGLTTYLRVISLVDDDPSPTIHEVRDAIILWEKEYLSQIVDEYGGPRYGRGDLGVTQYPKDILTASLCLRAMSETWVVHGDPKYRGWCITIYEWITGRNEGKTDLQQEKGYFINGFKALNTVDHESNITINVYTTTSLIYAKWINLQHKHAPTTKSISKSSPTETLEEVSTEKVTDASKKQTLGRGRALVVAIVAISIISIAAIILSRKKPI